MEQSAFLSLYEDVKKEDLKLLELIRDTNYRAANDSSQLFQSHYALLNEKRIMKGHRTPEKYRNLFCNNFSIKNDTLYRYAISVLRTRIYSRWAVPTINLI